MNDSNDPDPEDPIPEEVDKGLAVAFGAQSTPAPAQSVLQRIADVTGSEPKITLPEADAGGETPMLKPFGRNQRPEAGKYVVHGELGHGGVGTVHRAHDQDLGRDVAIKFLHEKYREEKGILHRFVEEAQIGGQLQHPGIVPVYDLGMVDGKPYFAMKLVKGVTLAKKLSDRTAMESDRRTFLSIFEDICQTMAYAHARSVVHRDLKPANIMIGSFGEVQVVDWGMGKVLQSGGVADEKRSVERQAEMSIIETARSAGYGTQSIMGSVMGTPAYMPPEQACGDVDAMDERSDVFALGAILCEILTGQPPYVGAGLKQLLKMAENANLEGAYARLAACGADPELVELTTQCLKPEPAGRPQTAKAVANSIQAHLASAEARVHEATARALALKRTQKLGIALTVVIAIGFAASLWMWREADAQRQTAESQREQADHIAKFMSETLAGASPFVAQGGDTTVLEKMMDTAAKRIDDGELEGNPEAELELRGTIGVTYIMLAKLPAAEQMLEPALELARTTHTGDHEATATAITQMAFLRKEQQDYAEAEKLGREALAMMQRVYGGDHLHIADCLKRLGNTLTFVHRPAEAKPLLEKALAMQERLVVGDDPGVAGALGSLSSVINRLGEHEEAELLQRRSLEMMQRVYPGDHPLVLLSLRAEGSLLFGRGELVEAERFLREALAMAKRLYSDDHPWLAAQLLALALSLQVQDEHAEAQQHYRDSLAMFERLNLGDGPQAALIRIGLGSSLSASGGDLVEAEQLLRECLTFRERESRDHFFTFNTKSVLGEVLMGQEKFADAEKFLREGYEGMKAREANIPPAGRTRIGEALERLVKFYEATDDETKAAAWRSKLEAARAELSQPDANDSKR